MRDAGALVPNIARAFGVTEAHVYRRLKLADLSAPVLDALAAGEISLGIASAFTVSNDEALTLAILEQAKNRSYYTEHQIKNLLNPESLQGRQANVRLVPPLSSLMLMFGRGQIRRARSGSLRGVAGLPPKEGERDREAEAARSGGAWVLP